MSFARNIVRDLVEKRLWPVALLMVVAIVAIPVIGAGGSDTGAGEGTVPRAPGDAANASSAVELLGPPSVRKRAGKVVDPFRRSGEAAAGSGSGVTGTDETGAPVGGSAPFGGASGGSSGGPSAGTTKGEDKPGSTVDKSGPSAYDLTKVADVRFGKRGGKLKRISNLAPLTELPSGDNAIVIFAGALKNKSVARFIIVSDGGETSGNGECKTKNEHCVSIDMQAGDQQLFRVDGTEYELHLVGINSVKGSGSKRSSASSGSAYRTRARFGSSSGASERSIARLAPLGGGDPALLYLGVFKGGKRALFVLGPHASAKGKRDCMDGAACRVIGLRRNEAAAVRLSSRSYVLKLESVRRLKLSAKAASRARARVAGGGRDALRNMLKHNPTSKALSHFRYSAASGTISRSGN